MRERVLFVDDDPNVLEAHKRKLRKALTVDTALGGKEALEVIAKKGPFAVIVADMHMPGMDGIQFLAKVNEQAPNTVRMMLTGHADIEVAVQAVNEGNIFRFLTKPCPPTVLGNALIAGINQYRLVTAEKELLEDTLNGSVKLVTEVLSMADPEAFGRAIEMKESVKSLARALRIKNSWDIELAAMFSQIGYITIPSEVVAKFRSGQLLSAEEEDMLSSVPEVGQKLLANIPRLESVARIVLYQNKCYDGSGFPKDAVAGEDIPLGSRILKVLADMADLEADENSKAAALGQMQNRKGWYDPKVLDATFDAFKLMGPAARRETIEVVDVQLSELHIGDNLLSNVKTSDGRFLIAARNRVSQVLLERLRNYARVTEVEEPIRVGRKVVRQ